MPNTANKAIPYPVATDTPDVPRDVLALANRVDALLSATEVPAASDMNTLTTSGRYFLDAATNGPDATAGWYVDVTRATATYIRQRARHGYAEWSPTYERVMVSGTWSAWTVVEPVRASGVVSVTPPAANSGVSVAVTFPAGRFSAAPKVMTNGNSNSYAATSAGAITASGFTARYYNPTGTVPTSPVVEWVATLEA